MVETAVVGDFKDIGVQIGVAVAEGAEPEWTEVPRHHEVFGSGGGIEREEADEGGVVDGLECTGLFRWREESELCAAECDCVMFADGFERDAERAEG